jgi:hypothetical protein
MNDDITFIGVDVDLEISLFKYGSIISEQEHSDGSGTHFAVYMIDEDHFGTGHITEEEIEKIGIEGFGTLGNNGFADWLGQTVEDWTNNSITTKLNDILQYYGYLNVFGTDYSPVNKEYVIKNYLKLEV